MSHRLARLAPRSATLASWILCIALPHCVQLTDGSDGGGMPKTWGMAERIHDAVDTIAPELAADPAGNAVAVWSQGDGIWSARYMPSDGWAAADSVTTFAAPLGSAVVAMDADGVAVAAWPLSWVRSNIYSARSGASGEWARSQRIDDNSGEADAPQVATGADGSVVVVWSQVDDQGMRVWSNRYTRSDGWSFAQPIDGSSAGEASRPQVAVDPPGSVTVVWQQADGTRTGIWSNRYTPSSGWGSARSIANGSASEAANPQVAVDPAGNAVAVWEQSDGIKTSIWSNRHTSAGWGAAERIAGEAGGDALTPQVGVDANGNAVAVWSQLDSTRNIWSNRYAPSRGWGTAERIDASDTANAREPRLAMDPSGNAVSVWRQSGGAGDGIWSSRYTQSEGWGSAQRIDPDEAGTRRDARVAIDDAGNATAVWSVSNSPGAGIWANRLD